MNKEEYVEYIKYDNSSGKKTKLTWLNKFHPELVVDILKFSKNLEIPFNQKVFHYVNDLKEIPTCLNCGNNVSFSYKHGAGYNKYCSARCSNKSEIKKIKIVKSNILKYDNKCSLQNEEVKNKSKITKLEKYGDENFCNYNKSKITKLEKYGDENYNNLSKIIKTNNERYGVNSTLSVSSIIGKSKITKLEKYGDENYNNRKKCAETKILKYGNDHYYNFEKKKKTCINKFGVDSFSKTDEFKKKLKNNHFNKSENKWCLLLGINKSDIKFDNNNIIIQNYCKDHNEFTINKKLFYNRMHYETPLCTECYPIGEQSSIAERELTNEIRKFYNGEILINNRNILKNFEIDIYFPEHKFGIEYNGLYWHSELFKDKNYHRLKTDLANENGIQLFQIFDDELILKKEIIFSMIKHKLNLTTNKIHGRKCIIKDVDIKTSNKFLDENHIQGACKSNYKIGLFYNNELVSLMTFEKSRKSITNISNSYHLNRFCNKINTVVIGAPNKLLNFFLKRNKASEIISFADKRFSFGNLYKKLGFDKIKEVDESYFVFKKKEYVRYHRFNFNKKNMIRWGWDSKKSESELLLENGYLKIYDSGKIKYSLLNM